MYTFTELNSTQLQLSPDIKILKAGDYNQYYKASELIESAKKTATKIIDKANSDYEVQKNKGYQEGLTEIHTKQSQMMLDMLSHCKDYYIGLTPQIAELAHSTIKKLIGEFDDIDLTIRLAEQAIKLRTSQREITLHVSPEQEFGIRQHISQLKNKFPDTILIEVIANKRVKQGGCLLETKIGIIDATLDSQMAAIEERFFSKVDSKS